MHTQFNQNNFKQHVHSINLRRGQLRVRRRALVRAGSCQSNLHQLCNKSRGWDSYHSNYVRPQRERKAQQLWSFVRVASARNHQASQNDNQ
jgi:hypothetical protein